MKWYDLFSSFYDSSLEKLYFESRKRAVELLDLKPEHTLLDVACGTGSNFVHIKSLSDQTMIYATDCSEGMLEKAKLSTVKNSWNDITLFQADARELNHAYIYMKTYQRPAFDCILCVLGLSVIPDWEMVLDNLLHLLKDKGKIVIVDVFAEKRTFNTWLVEKIAMADLKREIWQRLEDKTDDFSLEYLPVKESKVGGKLFVASAIKR